MQAPGDLSFGDTGAVQFPDCRSMDGRSCRPPQSLSVLPRLGKASTGSQNLPFELSEDGKQSRHGATSRRRQIQSFSERNETDTKMLQLLQC